MASRLVSRAFSSRVSGRIVSSPRLQHHAVAPLAVFAFRRGMATTKRFTPEHEYVLYDSDSKIGTMSITDYAQKSLGDVVFVELPVVGTEVAKGAHIGAVESVKAASDIYAPISGKVTEVNKRLSDEPGLLNKDPEGEGWLCKIEASEPKEIESLLDDKAYQKVCEGDDH